MVPELSWKQNSSVTFAWRAHVSTQLVYLIQLHKSLPQSINFIPVDFFQWTCVSGEERIKFLSSLLLQLDPWMMLSSIWLLDPPGLLRASKSAASFADATLATVSMLIDRICEFKGGWAMIEWLPAVCVMYESLVGVIYKPRGQLLRQSVDSLNCQIRGRREVSGREPFACPLWVSSGPGSRRSRALTLSS